ncbi:MAG: hypothetical protein AB4426_35595 [Xenococcaceae cyanobacterium]
MDDFHYVDYVVAAFGGTGIAFIELLRAFPRDMDIVLRNLSAWALLGLNATAAIGVYAFVSNYLVADQDNTLVTALTVGVAFPMVIRSRFTLYRSPQSELNDSPLGTEELSLKFDEFYQTLQEWFYSQINMVLAEERSQQVTSIKKNMTLEKIKKEVDDRIDSWPNETQFQKKQKKQYEKYRDEIIADYANNPEKKANYLVRFLITITPKKKLRKLIAQKSTPET